METDISPFAQVSIILTNESLGRKEDSVGVFVIHLFDNVGRICRQSRGFKRLIYMTRLTMYLLELPLRFFLFFYFF